MLWEANSQGSLVGIRSAHRSANGCVVCDDALGHIDVYVCGVTVCGQRG